MESAGDNRGSCCSDDDSLPSTAENDIVAKLNKLSTALLGTSSNVTILNQRLTEYQRSHEIALEEIRRNVIRNNNSNNNRHSGDSRDLRRSSPLGARDFDKESTPHHAVQSSGPRLCCSNSSHCNTEHSPINTLVSLLGEKDISVASLTKEIIGLRQELERMSAQLRRVHELWARDKENADTFKRTVHLQLRKNIDMVNRLIADSGNVPASVKRTLAHRPPQEDFIGQQAELSSKLEWLATHLHNIGALEGSRV